MAKPRGWQMSLGPEREAEIVSAFQAGTPAIELARRYERSSSHIYSVLRRAGLRPDANWKPGPHRDLELEAKIVAYYQRGPAGGARAAAKHLDVSYATVCAVLKRHNIPIRKPGIPKDVIERIREMRLSGSTQHAIGQALGFHQSVISRVCNTLGLRSPKHRMGKHSGSWKGGRLIINGYVRVWLPRDHRFFEAMAMHDGYVWEHRLVMAETLGRPLLPSETVHHIDGVKTHNDPSNLQLRHSNHGKGIVLRCRQCGSHDIEATELH